ncbi:ABC transporter permease [Actinomadura yumaensis]|uniref:ABC transporter permease n=1 Tax=Actinomadura yumaensis TaxID=111807 RepID=A0ABW2CWE2_9ACTN
MAEATALGPPPDAAAAPPAARRRRGPSGRGAALLLPGLVVVAVVFVVPMARLAWLSVTTPETGLANYRDVLTDGVSLTVIWRTLRMMLVVTAVCLLFAYPYAYVMTVVPPRTRAVLTTIVLLPFWTSLMARTFAWVVLLQKGGPVNDALAALGLGDVRLAGSATGVTIAMAQVMLPFMVLPLYSSMRDVDRALVPAALSLGARPAVAFLRVYLPLTLPGVAAGTTLVAVLSLGFYVTPALLGSPKESMIAQLIAVKVQDVLDFGAGGALSLTLLVVALALLGLVARFVRPGAALGMSDEGDRR